MSFKKIVSLVVLMATCLVSGCSLFGGKMTEEKMYLAFKKGFEKLYDGSYDYTIDVNDGKTDSEYNYYYVNIGEDYVYSRHPETHLFIINKYPEFVMYGNDECVPDGGGDYVCSTKDYDEVGYIKNELKSFIGNPFEGETLESQREIFAKELDEITMEFLNEGKKEYVAKIKYKISDKEETVITIRMKDNKIFTIMYDSKSKGKITITTLTFRNGNTHNVRFSP